MNLANSESLVEFKVQKKALKIIDGVSGIIFKKNRQMRRRAVELFFIDGAYDIPQKICDCQDAPLPEYMGKSRHMIHRESPGNIK